MTADTGTRRALVRICIAIAACCLIGLVIMAALPVHHDWTSEAFGIAFSLLALYAGPHCLRRNRGNPRDR